jgi:hypothetical protein
MTSTVRRQGRRDREPNTGWSAIFKGWLTGIQTVEQSGGSAEPNTEASRGMSPMLPSGSLFSTIYAGRRISLRGREAGLTKP